MKRKFIIIPLCIAVVLCLLFFWLRSRNIRLFDDINVNAIDKIVIYHPGDTENTFSDPEGKKKVISLLQKMHLNKTFSNGKAGGLLLDIYYKNGDITCISLLSDTVAVDTDTYTCDRDYCDDFRKLCEELQYFRIFEL